jgi:ParB family chromosome partitioning protein
VIENVQREDLNVVEEAFAYKTLIDQFDLTQDQIAKQVGKSRPAIANLLRLLELPDEVLEQLKAGDLSAGHARALLGLTDPEKIVPLSNRIIAKNLSVRETEVLVKRENIAPAPELPDIEGKPQNRAYMMDLERRTRETLGRKVKVTQNNKKKSIELYYEDDADMEALLLALCGPDFFNEEL